MPWEKISRKEGWEFWDGVITRIEWLTFEQRPARGEGVNLAAIYGENRESKRYRSGPGMEKEKQEAIVAEAEGGTVGDWRSQRWD